MKRNALMLSSALVAALLLMGCPNSNTPDPEPEPEPTEVRDTLVENAAGISNYSLIATKTELQALPDGAVMEVTFLNNSTESRQNYGIGFFYSSTDQNDLYNTAATTGIALQTADPFPAGETVVMEFDVATLVAAMTNEYLCSNVWGSCVLTKADVVYTE